jgi:hypothetical protein
MNPNNNHTLDYKRNMGTKKRHALRRCLFSLTEKNSDTKILGDDPEKELDPAICDEPVKA